MLEGRETPVNRDIEIKALAARLRAKAKVLGVCEPDLNEIEISYKLCGILGCNEIESMECPPQDKGL